MDTVALPREKHLYLTECMWGALKTKSPSEQQIGIDYTRGEEENGSSTPTVHVLFSGLHSFRIEG